MERSTDGPESKHVKLTENSDHHHEREHNGGISAFGRMEDRKNIAECLAKIGISIASVEGSAWLITSSRNAVKEAVDAAVRNQNFLDRLVSHSSPEQCSLRLIVDQNAPKDDGGEFLLSILECIHVKDISIQHRYCGASTWISFIEGKLSSCENLHIDCATIGYVGCKILLDQLKSDSLLNNLKIRGDEGSIRTSSWDIRRDESSNFYCTSTYECHRCHLGELGGGDNAVTEFVQRKINERGGVVTLSHCIFGNEDADVLAKARDVNLTTSINGNAMGMLASSIQNNHQLTELKIESGSPINIYLSNGEMEIEPAGCEVIASFLQSPNCNLRTLGVLKFQLDDECAAILARGIRGNKSLKEFSLYSVIDNTVSTITRRGWNAFSKALCDTTSINGSYFSNHTLKNIGIGKGIPSIKITRCLLFNKSSTDKKEIALICELLIRL